jgi:hypothetical protein
VSEGDAFVVAINPRSLGHEIFDTIPPRILQAAFHIGSPAVSVDSKTAAVISQGVQTRMSILKASGSVVPTGAFLTPSGEALSGLLCSRVDAANRPSDMGGDFQLVPNPLAIAPLPPSFRLPGKYFEISRDGDWLVIDTA